MLLALLFLRRRSPSAPASQESQRIFKYRCVPDSRRLGLSRKIPTHVRRVVLKGSVRPKVRITLSKIDASQEFRFVLSRVLPRTLC